MDFARGNRVREKLTDEEGVVIMHDRQGERRVFVRWDHGGESWRDEEEVEDPPVR